MRVLALDPGITTGTCFAEFHDDGPINLEVEQQKFTHLEFLNFIALRDPAIVVCESFEYRGRSRNNLELFSRELIGIVRLYSEWNRKKLVMQSATQGKGYFSDEKLKELELYVKKSHGRDATRHFLQWLHFGGGFHYYHDRPIQLLTDVQPIDPTNDQQG